MLYLNINYLARIIDDSECEYPVIDIQSKLSRDTLNRYYEHIKVKGAQDELDALLHILLQTNKNLGKS